MEKHSAIEILTISEVAKMLRVHRSTVSRFAKSGELPSYVLGNRRLFKKSDVILFFEKKIASNYVSERSN
ncbi:MAG: helix-turn-helix domain-containing protein [Bacteroidetes bacterium]|nr:helix-turn-helix domain-containing protein [Bacteroidota bacterium]